MSYTAMLRVSTNMPLAQVEEYKNSWGSAMRVWTAIGDRYFAGQNILSMNESDAQEFWDLHRSPRLQWHERMTLAWTFDWAICEKQHCSEIAEQLRKFDVRNPVKSGYVNHLPKIAADLVQSSILAEADDTVVGFAFSQTSVNSGWYISEQCPDQFHHQHTNEDNPSCPTCGNYQDDSETHRRFDWSKDSKAGRHFMLFESIPMVL